MVKKAFILLSVLALLAIFGCASGGNKDVATGGESGKTTIKDEAASRGTSTPAKIHYQSAVQFLAAGNYDEAISHLRTATTLKPELSRRLGRARKNVS